MKKTTVLINRTIVFCFLFLAIAFLPSFSLAQSRSNASLAKEILKYVNEHRDSMGLAPLQTNDVISQAAEKHSSNMAQKIVPFGHDGFDDRIGNLLKELRPANAGAENVADGVTNAREAVNLWLHSTGHRKNIEGNFNLTGIGIASSSDGKIYITQIFIHKS